MPPGVQRGRAQIPRLIQPYGMRRDPQQTFGQRVTGIGTTQQNQSRNDKQRGKTKPALSAPQKEEIVALPIEIQTEFDDYLIEAYNSSVVDATESFLLNKFEATSVVYFVDVATIQQLFSPTYGISSSRSSGIVGYSYFTRSTIKTSKPTAHPSFHPGTDSLMCPQDSPVMVIPLWDYRDNIIAVVEIIRPPSGQDFTEEDENFIKVFQYKYQLFSRFLLKGTANEPLLLDLLSLDSLENLVPSINEKLSNYFGCRICEIWKYDAIEKIVTLLGKKETTKQLTESGIIGIALSQGIIFNCPRIKLHPSFNPSVDGSLDESILVMPVTTSDENIVFGVVLRGSMGKSVFTPDDESSLSRVAPFVALSILNSEIYSEINGEFEKSRAEREGLAALLEVAEILSGQLEIERLTEVIMEKGRALTHADRCSLFLVSQSKDRLITSFQRGLKNSIDLPINKGIAGQTVTERKIINIEDAYDDPKFDNTTDTETGYRTRSILSVPIINNRGEVIGVTEMVNKVDMSPFTKWDAHLIQIFNVFCGVSLENARLYQQSNDMAQQLRSFFDVSFSLTKSGSLQKVLKDIISNARKSVESRRASLFLVDETTGTLSSFIVDGGKLPSTLPLTAGIVGSCVKTKEIVICNDAYSDPRFNRSVDLQTGFKTISLLAAPILSKNGTVIGVVEVINKENGSFNEKDMNLIQSFATFASVSLENSRLKDIAELGSAEIEINKYIGESERSLSSVPIRFTLTEDQKKIASSLNFFCNDWKGIGQVKLLFYIFDKYNLLERFSITNEMFFRFIYEVRSSYHDAPYHNWTHAVDVTEYVSYELETAKLANVFTPLEIFALLVSAVCHDVGHDGFNNAFNEKSQTPLGILFKNQSVMETHHCTVAIKVLTNDDTNLFHALSQSDNKKMWTWITKLILATDMAHHFKMVKDTSALLDAGTFDIKNEEHRTLAMQLILKVGDISNVSRPFQTADKWCDILCEEFFRQGDKEVANGLGLSSPLNDRHNQDKPKGQIGFYNFVCLPLYQVVSRVFPPLIVNLESIKANLEVWKSLVLTEQKS